MSVNYSDKEWEIIDGVRYRKAVVTPKSNAVKTKSTKSKKKVVEPITPEPYIETEIED